MPTARLRLSNVCEIASRNCPKAQQSLSSVMPCTLSTKCSIALYRYCNYKHCLDSTTQVLFETANNE
jgi:hypothetical protein